MRQALKFMESSSPTTRSRSFSFPSPPGPTAPPTNQLTTNVGLFALEVSADFGCPTSCFGMWGSSRQTTRGPHERSSREQDLAPPALLTIPNYFRPLFIALQTSFTAFETNQVDVLKTAVPSLSNKVISNLIFSVPFANELFFIASSV